MKNFIIEATEHSTGVNQHCEMILSNTAIEDEEYIKLLGLIILLNSDQCLLDDDVSFEELMTFLGEEDGKFIAHGRGYDVDYYVSDIKEFSGEEMDAFLVVSEKLKSVSTESADYILESINEKLVGHNVTLTHETIVDYLKKHIVD